MPGVAASGNKGLIYQSHKSTFAYVSSRLFIIVYSIMHFVIDQYIFTVVNTPCFLHAIKRRKHTQSVGSEIPETHPVTNVQLGQQHFFLNNVEFVAGRSPQATPEGPLVDLALF